MRSLDELIARGRRLSGEISLIALADDLAAFRREHRAWVVDCLGVLAAGFEPETVYEFVHVNSRVCDDDELTLATKAADAATRDAVELLDGLHGTLSNDPPTRRGWLRPS
jgi:hypothetical protein